jgi:hypothetical protein
MYSKKKLLKIYFICFVVLLAGCIKLWPDEVSSLAEEGSGIGSQEGIMIVFISEFSYEENISDVTDEENIIECITDEIKDARPDQKIIPFDEFQRTAYPNLSPKEAPKSPFFIRKLLEHPDFMEKIASLYLGYIVFVSGASEATSTEATGAGHIGFIGRGKKTHLKASILDLKDKEPVGTAQANTSGGQGALIVGFPFPVIAATESITCTALGEELVNILESKTTSITVKDEL